MDSYQNEQNKNVNRRRFLQISGVPIIAALGIGLAGCEDETTGTTPIDTTPASTSPQSSSTVDVDIVNFSFEPETVSVTAGTTVKQTNRDSVMHTVTSSSGEGGTTPDGRFDSGSINNGQSWSQTFTEPGTYYYYCIFHPYMQASVTVT